MKQLSMLLVIAMVGLAVGVLAGWTDNNYRYRVAQGEQYEVLPRQALPITREQDFCLYADVKYRHGELIYLTTLDMTQICVIDEKARWAVVPKRDQITTIEFSPNSDNMIIKLQYKVKDGSALPK